MTAKATYKSGEHPSRGTGCGWATWLIEVDCEEKMKSLSHNLTTTERELIDAFCKGLDALTDILGRDLTTTERELIVKTLTRLLPNDIGVTVTHQEKKETLRAIANADDVTVWRAFRDCDEMTELLILEAGADMGVTIQDDCKPALIRAAAGHALRTLGRGKKPEEARRTALAVVAHDLWAALGRTDFNTSAGKKKTSAFVRFSSRLNDMINPRGAPDPSNVAKALREVRKVIA
jgi:hypothetical protein